MKEGIGDAGNEIGNVEYEIQNNQLRENTNPGLLVRGLNATNKIGLQPTFAVTLTARILHSQGRAKARCMRYHVTPDF